MAGGFAVSFRYDNYKIEIPSIKSGKRTDEQKRLINEAISKKVALRDSFYLIGDDNYIYFYTHLKPNSTNNISEGQRVSAGDPLAEVGDDAAGDFRGSHLHISAVSTESGISPDNPYGDFFLARDLLPLLYNNR